MPLRRPAHRTSDALDHRLLVTRVSAAMAFNRLADERIAR